jgi:hypothetical protein
MSLFGKLTDYKKAARNKKYKKLRAAARKPLEIREVSNEFLNIPEPFKYVIYFERKLISNLTRATQTQAVKEFTSHGFSGKWAMFYDDNFRNKEQPLLARLYLEEESDLVMLRLCHNLAIRRINKLRR